MTVGLDYCLIKAFWKLKTIYKLRGSKKEQRSVGLDEDQGKAVGENNQTLHCQNMLLLKLGLEKIMIYLKLYEDKSVNNMIL